MMKKLLFILLMLIIPNHAMALEGLYVKGNIGMVIVDNQTVILETEDLEIPIGQRSSDIGYGMNVAVGKSFGFLDLELEYGFREAGLDKFEATKFDTPSFKDLKTADEELSGVTHLETLMVNGILNLGNSSHFIPYLGGGIGVAWVANNTKIAYQALLGINTPFNKNLSLFYGYRFIHVKNISKETSHDFSGKDNEGDNLMIPLRFEGKDVINLNTHNIEIGLKYTF